jgi:ParB family chromosome partitioning protein
MPEFLVVPISSLSAPEAPLRMAMDRPGLEELTLSIRQVGLLQPLVVMKREHGYEVKAGHRRLLACRMAPLERVPIYVFTGDAEFEAAVMLAENIQRRDLSPIEEAQSLRTMRETLGLSVADCAQRCAKSDAWVRGRLDLLSWPLAAVEALGRDAISVSALAPLMEITEEAERDRLIRCAVEGGATAAVTRSWVASMRGEIAEGMEGHGARAQASMRIADVVVSMPCYVCEEVQPAIDLRIVRVCDRCVADLERIRESDARERAAESAHA